MGQHSPALAAGLAATAALLGLQLGAPSSPASPTAPSATAAGAPPAAVLVAAPVVRRASTPSPVGSSAAVSSALATNATAHAPCSAGLIALTFDDGPSAAVTPRLVRTLVALKVPATFFMIGSHVAAHPRTARLVRDAGFTIANHTWSHPELTHLSNRQIRSQIRATGYAFKKAYITASPRLMRPPYGDINGRVRGVIRDLGLIPVLWSIDSRDWAGGDRVAIAHRILSALRPHGTNLVLQHDGVNNSPASVAAVPLVVRAARKRGYCFTHLSATGQVGGKAATTATRTQVTRRPVHKPAATRPVVTASSPIGERLRTTRGDGFRVLFSSRTGVLVPRVAFLRELLADLPLRR